MDFKKFGLVILILGILFFSYGGFQYISKQPKKFNPAESERTILGRNDFGNWLDVESTNRGRARKREDSIKISVAGGIVAFVGLGMFFSAKKKEK